MQATSDGGAGNFRAVADLSDGQVPFALLKRLDHGQPSGQGRHEVRVTGQGLDALGRRSNDGWRYRSKGVAQLVVHIWSFPGNGGYYKRLPAEQTRAGCQHRSIIEPSTDNRNQGTLPPSCFCVKG